MSYNNNSTELRRLVERFDAHLKTLVASAAELAFQGGHAALDIEHVLLAIVSSDDQLLQRRIEAAGGIVTAIRRQLVRVLAKWDAPQGVPPAISSRLVKVLGDAAVLASLDRERNAVTVDSVIGALSTDGPLYANLCDSVPALARFSVSTFFDQAVAASCASPPDKLKGNIAAADGRLRALNKFTIDLTKRARDGLIDPVVGREREIAQVIEILLRRRQNNPILTGEAGVGKTAIVEGLAQRIAQGTVPDALREVTICSLDMGLLKAGAGVKGEIESRLKQIIAEVAAADRPVILFVDEAHTLVGGGASGNENNDLANLIKPELARGVLRTIAATTWSEYKRYFEKDAALSRRFQVVKADEPRGIQTQQILMSLVPSLQTHHGVYILQEAIESAVDLSTRYIQGRCQPDKAISVLDTACARSVAQLSGPSAESLALLQRLSLWKERIKALEWEQSWGASDGKALARASAELTSIENSLHSLNESDSEKTPSSLVENTSPAIRVGTKEIASVIADWTGVPSSQMLVDRAASVIALEATLNQRVVGQERAIGTISKRIAAYAASLLDANSPIGVFLLVGPSGIGKTETAHAIANAFFGGDQCMTVVNLSEYQEAHTVSKLKGAPPGYVGFGQGGILTEAVRRRPYGVLLLDELEKAHADVIDLFLQVFDKGFLEDSEGVRVDFRNTLIMMTSNACDELFENVQRGNETVMQTFENTLREKLVAYFRPAFLGRVQLVPYFPLRQSDVSAIVEMKLSVLRERYERTYDALLDISPSFVREVVERTSSSLIGARFIDQFVSDHIYPALSDFVLECMARGERVADMRLNFKAGRVSVAPIRTKKKS